SSLRGLPADVCANVLVDERLWKIVRRFLPNRIPGKRDSVNGLGQWTGSMDQIKDRSASKRFPARSWTRARSLEQSQWRESLKRSPY
ncbi:MAG: hypothetical protein VXA98_11460, partial [Gammaproteobacteria bacterium]